MANPAQGSTTPEYVVVGPQTWEEYLPILLTLTINGHPQGRALARSELLKMARAADRLVKLMAVPGFKAAIADVEGR